MRNMVHTREWAAMRVAITRRNPASVYVVPRCEAVDEEATRAQKDNFARRMQTLALDPALKENTDKVIQRAEDFLDRLGNKHGF